MSTQISLQLSDKMLNAAKMFSDIKGYDTLQDMIRETLREKIFESENEQLSGLFTAIASEKSLAKDWLRPEEDEAWAHLQEEI